jgi:photosystem II stability/assembly factor-like uncharacterized protein
LADENVTSISVSDGDGGEIHAPTDDLVYAVGEGKTWKAVKHGEAWVSVKHSPASQAPRSISAVAPSHHAVVYRADGDKIFRSQNGGRQWELRAGIGHNYRIRTLAVHPQDPNIVYASTEVNGVFMSPDGGQSWNTLNRTLPAQGDGLQCPALAIHPKQPEVVFIACHPHGVFVSPDSGMTWTPRNEGITPSLQINALAIVPVDPRASFYDSNPLQVSLKYPYPQYLPIVMRSQSRSGSSFLVYMGTEAGVWRLVLN